MYLKDITNSPIADNDDAYLIMIEKVNEKPFVGLKKQESSFKVLGLPMLSTFEENRLYPDTKSNEYRIFKEILENDGIIHERQQTSEDVVNTIQMEFLQRKMNNKEYFKDWDNIINNIYNEKLKVKAFSKALKLNYVSLCAIKKSVFDEILKSYDSPSMGKYNEFAIEFPKLFITENKVQEVLNRNAAKLSHLLRFFSEKNIIVDHNSESLMPFVFVLNGLEENGFFIQPYDFTYEGLNNCNFRKKIIELESDNHQNINCKFENYKVLTWSQINTICKNHETITTSYLKDYKELLLNHMDSDKRIYLHKDEEDSYLENINRFNIALSNIKHNLQMKGQNIIIQM